MAQNIRIGGLKPPVPKRPGPPPLTFLEFATLANASYSESVTTAAGFTRHTPNPQHTGKHYSGFHGCTFRRSNGGGTDRVVALAGTEDMVDGKADLGFGGDITRAASGMLSTASNGIHLLQTQISRGVQLATAERQLMKGNDRIYITGHSLGGGLAQIVAIKTSIPAVTFHGVAIGAMSEYDDAKAHVVNLRVKNDPVNNVAGLSSLKGGSFVGMVIWLQTSRTGLDAHRMPLTLKELSPAGPFSALGQSDPFSTRYHNPEEQRAANRRAF